MQRLSEIAEHHQTHQWPNFDRHVRWRSNRLARLFRLSYHDREDLHQSMALDLVKAMHRYDPARASRNTFASRVLDKSYMHHARRLARASSCPNAIYCDPNMLIRDRRRSDYHDDQIPQSDRAEVRQLVHLLPIHLANLACQITSRSVIEIAESNGVHRGTIYRQLRKLRPHFCDHDPKCD